MKGGFRSKKNLVKLVVFAGMAGGGVLVVAVLARAAFFNFDVIPLPAFGG